jgi:hypothetical protein
LYADAVEACDAAKAADAAGDLAQWTHWVGRAQVIAASFYDVARDDSDPARLFKRYHGAIWQALTKALLQHDLDQLATAQAALEECLRQVRARLQARAATEAVEVTW